MQWFNKKLVTIIAVLLVALGVTGVALAQDDLPPCVYSDGSAGSCVILYLTPDTLIGEFWANDVYYPFDVGKVNLVTGIDEPGVKDVIEFRNIEDPSDPLWNVLYVYNNVKKTVTYPGYGEWRDVPFAPTKKYIRGTVEVTCDIKSWVAENVSCAVTIDDVPQATPILAGQKASYIVDPGSHNFVVTLTGDPAQTILWSPASLTKKVFVSASATVSKQKFSFSKAAHLISNMDKPGALADWYVDGVLVGTQVASIDQWVNPTKAHKVEVKNITDATLDPLSLYLFHWKDATQSPFIASGKEKTVTFKLTKEGNWAQPWSYKIPKDSLVEGPHTYTLTVSCSDGSAFSNTINFNVAADAQIVYPELYMVFTGIEKSKLIPGTVVDPISPKQTLKALVTLADRDKNLVSALAAECGANISIDGAEPVFLTADPIYRIKP
jgi:hypothetical protein